LLLLGLSLGLLLDGDNFLLVRFHFEILIVGRGLVEGGLDLFEGVPPLRIPLTEVIFEDVDEEVGHLLHLHFVIHGLAILVFGAR